jgi:hypothetical protein
MLLTLDASWMCGVLQDLLSLAKSLAALPAHVRLGLDPHVCVSTHPCTRFPPMPLDSPHSYTHTPV